MLVLMLQSLANRQYGTRQRLQHAGITPGHHGSAYSSSPDFIAAIHPRYAIISVGSHNLYGHPAPSTIATLERFGAEVYRTDQNAAISVLTGGATIQTGDQLVYDPR